VLEFNATLLAQIVDFIILLIFLRLVAYKPLMKVLKDRQDYIEKNIAAAEQERQQAEQLRAGYEAEIIESAKSEAARIKEAALADIQREKEKAVAELREQVATLSVLVAGKIIGRQMTQDIQREMVQEFIKEAGELPC